MTLRSFINFGRSRQFAAGVSIHILTDGDVTFSYCVLNEKKGLVTLLRQETGIRSITELRTKLSEVLPENSRMHINLHGNAVLSKKTDPTSEPFDGKRMMKTLFPMIKTEEFVFQLYRNEYHDFYSIVSKDLFDTVSDLKRDYSLLSLSLGAFVTGSILQFISQEYIAVGASLIQINDNKIQDVLPLQADNSSYSLTVGGETIPPDNLPAYAAAWNILLPSAGLYVGVLTFVEESSLAYSVYSRLYLSARVGLLAGLIILILNSMLYFWLQSENETLKEENRFSAGKNMQQDLHFKRLSELQKAYDSLGWKSNIVGIYYADQLASTIVTEDIRLTTLEVGVQDQSMQRRDNRVYYQASLILIKGASSNPIALQRWIYAIEKLGWVSKIFAQKYKYDAKQNMGVFEFYVKIK